VLCKNFVFINDFLEIAATLLNSHVDLHCGIVVVATFLRVQVAVGVSVKHVWWVQLYVGNVRFVIFLGKIASCRE